MTARPRTGVPEISLRAQPTRPVTNTICSIARVPDISNEKSQQWLGQRLFRNVIPKILVGLAWYRKLLPSHYCQGRRKAIICWPPSASPIASSGLPRSWLWLQRSVFASSSDDLHETQTKRLAPCP